MTVYSSSNIDVATVDLRSCGVSAITATDSSDLSVVTNMSSAFCAASSLDADLSGWDVSNVTEHSDFSTGWGRENTEPVWP